MLYSQGVPLEALGIGNPAADPRAADLGLAAKSADPVQAIFGSNGLLASDWVLSDADRRAIHTLIA